MRRVFGGRKLVYFLSTTNVLLLVLIGYLVLLKNSTPASSMAEEYQKYPLLSKRIFAESQNDILINFVPMNQVLREYIGENKNISIYFEYLPSGTSTSINDEMEVKIASLVKVPTAMAIYKAIEQKQLSLDQKVTVQQGDINKEFGDLWKRGIGATLTIQEALDLMLIQSDNTAYSALWRILSQNAINDVLNALNIPLDEEGQFLLITTRRYTSIMRSLYLSSYLQRENSQKILETLTKTNFRDKLEAGVPDDVPVAHKIGNYKPANGSSEQTYSDCGIIYQPSRPYALCVMVAGESEDKAREHMKNISQLIYGFVSEVSSSTPD